MNNIAIVTGVVGDYDRTLNHAYTQDVDYFYFTDGKSWPSSKRWTVVGLPDLKLHPRKLAKLPKLHPHLFPFLREYEFVIWIDGSMSINHENVPHEVISNLDKDILLSPHFDGRDSAYSEATIRPAKYANEPLDEQVAAYRADGFPEHFGLYEAGLLTRRMASPEIERLGELWLLQNLLWSYQDQVSLPYCLWKLGIVPDVLPQTFRNYNWVHLNAHKSEV